MKKKLLVLIGIAGCLALGFGAVKVHAAYYGRGEFVGYFSGLPGPDSGKRVLPMIYHNDLNGDGKADVVEAFPASINSADKFIKFVEDGLDANKPDGSPYWQIRAGSSLMILTMIGAPTNDRYIPPSFPQRAEWEKRVRYAEKQGWITWRQHSYDYNINSMYVVINKPGGGQTADDSFFSQSGSKDAMVFRNSAGKVVYAIKWECANPVGWNSLGQLEEASEYNVTGWSWVSQPTVRPGQTVTFKHYVKNNGPDSTSPKSVWRTVRDGLNPAKVIDSDSMGVLAPGQKADATSVENYKVPLGTAPGTKICRFVQWQPVSDSNTGVGQGATVCATVVYDYDLDPVINFKITNGGVVVPGSTAQEGDQITFSYVVNNSGSTISRDTTCLTYGRIFAGAHNAINPPANPPPPGWGAGPATGCPRTFPAGSTITLAVEPVAATPANSTICRSLYVRPPKEGVATYVGYEVCVKVAAKPYVKIYGADTVAGGRLENSPGSGTCTLNKNAGIASWNTRNAAYSGAGTQYGAFALSTINDFATTQGAGGAPVPSGLAFKNSGITPANKANGLFGGNFGSVSCTPDYYGKMPTAATPVGNIVNVTSLHGAQAYRASGNVIINGGNINPNDRMSLYIDGNVYISSAITYSNNWNLNSAPLFHLIVRGNIFIDRGAGRLDGLYIAQQKTNGTAGSIYTCTTAASKFAQISLDGNLYSACNNKLLVNGSFAAKDILLMRSFGTLSKSTTDADYNSNNAAEVFNYNPIDWIVQPEYLDNTATGGYDAMTSLPPVL